MMMWASRITLLVCFLSTITCRLNSKSLGFMDQACEDMAIMVRIDKIFFMCLILTRVILGFQKGF